MTITSAWPTILNDAVAKATSTPSTMRTAIHVIPALLVGVKMLSRGRRAGNAASARRHYLPLVHPERVSTFELFFDLVFVFTITQLTGALHADSSATGVLRVLLMLAVIWWMYGGYAWLTNAVSAEQGRYRLALLVGMIGFLAVSLAIPTAFTTGGVVFGLGYLLVVLVHVTLFGQAGAGAIRGMRVVGPRNVGAALVIILAGALASRTTAPVGLMLWGAAVAHSLASAAGVHRDVASRSDRRTSWSGTASS